MLKNEKKKLQKYLEKKRDFRLIFILINLSY